MIEFTLPLPVSTNNLYANVPGKGRVKTKAYRAWINEAGWSLKTQRPGSLSGRVKTAYVLPESCGLDADNIKALGDLLESMGVVENDRLIRDLHITFADRENVLVRLEPCPT